MTKELGDVNGIKPLNYWLGSMVIMTMSLLASRLFLPYQELWADETAYLWGAELEPEQLLQWLRKPDTPGLNFQQERHPPLGFWIAATWAKLFGRTDLAYRCLGILATVMAAGMVFRIAYRHFGVRSAWIAGVLFALAPNVVWHAVEIRSYPWFLLFATAATGALLDWWAKPNPGSLAWLPTGLWLALAMYTHFWGSILAAAMGLIVLIHQGSRSRSVWLLGGFLLIVLGSLSPFILGSIGVPNAEKSLDWKTRLVGNGQMLYRQIGHPTLVVYPIIYGLNLLMGAGLVCLAILPKREDSNLLRKLLGMIGIGLGASAIINMLSESIYAAKPSYHVWTIPVWCLVFGILARRGGWGLGLVFGLLFTNLCGVYVLATHGTFYAHAPSTRLQQKLEEQDLSRTVLVHLNSNDYPQLFFPLNRHMGKSLQQWIVQPRGQTTTLSRVIHLDQPEDIQTLRTFDTILLVQVRDEDSKSLAEQIRHGLKAPEQIPLMMDLLQQGYDLQELVKLPAFFAADVAILKRK